MLYHEATFLEEHLDRASTTFHSTAMEAARIAVKAEVGKLLLGHFSVRYKDILPLQEEARTIFKTAMLPLKVNLIFWMIEQCLKVY